MLTASEVRENSANVTIHLTVLNSAVSGTSRNPAVPKTVVEKALRELLPDSNKEEIAEFVVDWHWDS